MAGKNKTIWRGKTKQVRGKTKQYCGEKQNNMAGVNKTIWRGKTKQYGRVNKKNWQGLIKPKSGPLI